MLEPQVVDGRRAGAREEQPYGSLRPACVWKSLSVAIVGKLQVYAVVEDEVELMMSAGFIPLIYGGRSFDEYYRDQFDVGVN